MSGTPFGPGGPGASWNAQVNNWKQDQIERKAKIAAKIRRQHPKQWSNWAGNFSDARGKKPTARQTIRWAKKKGLWG